MKIEVLHVRSLDYACDVRVFVDGMEVGGWDTEVVDIDPGRGYTLDDWNENIAWAESLPESPFRTAVLEAYRDPPASEYIQGWDEHRRGEITGDFGLRG